LRQLFILVELDLLVDVFIGTDSVLVVEEEEIELVFGIREEVAFFLVEYFLKDGGQDIVPPSESALSYFSLLVTQSNSFLFSLSWPQNRP
jgi:hypothetical protein